MANLKLQTGAGGLPAAPNALGLADLIIVGQSGGLATIGTSYRSSFTDAKALVLAGLTAASVANVPAGNISATNVQTAINELDTEKAGLALANVFTAFQSINLNVSAPRTPPTGTVLQITQVDGADGSITIDTFNGGVPEYSGRRAGGTNAAPSAVASANALLRFNAFGYGASAYSAAARGQLTVRANEAWSNTAQGTRFEIVLTANGTTTTAIVGTWTGGGGLFMNGATGGDQGAGTINAVNYLVNGVNINAIYAGLAAANVFTQPQTINTNSTTAAGYQFEVQNSAAGAFGPFQALFQDSPSPAVADNIGGLGFDGRDSGGNRTFYTGILAFILDPTDGSEDGRLRIYALVAGANTPVAEFANGVVVGAPTGSFQGTGTLNATALYTNGNLVADTNGLLRTRAYTVGTLPAAAGITGAIARVTDALVAPVYAAAATGGGTTFAKVVSDGTIWRYG